MIEHWRIKTDAARDRRRARADRSAGCSPTTPRPTGIARLLDRARRAARAARRCFERYYGDLPTVMVEPGVRTGVPILYDNPQGGRRRPHRQRARRVSPLRRAGDRRRLRHRRPTSTRVRAGASSSAARSPRASRSRSTRWPRAPPGCSRSSSSGRGRSSASRPSSRCSRASSTASPARSTASSSRIVAELGREPRRDRHRRTCAVGPGGMPPRSRTTSRA